MTLFPSYFVMLNTTRASTSLVGSLSDFYSEVRFISPIITMRCYIEVFVMKKIFNSVLETIRTTPLINLKRVTSDLECTVLAKLESRNPGGSIKDRICLSMINEAERLGLINKKSVLIEPTSGNTGIGLAMVASVRGYRLILTMSDTMSLER